MNEHPGQRRRSVISRIAASMLVTAFVSMILIVPGVADESSGKIKAAFTDSSWDGETVPVKGICTSNGGKGMSPGIAFTNIPPGAKEIVLKFTDEDWGSEGAHGEFSISVPSGSSTLDLPEFSGDSGALPPGTTMLAGHVCGSCGGVGYLGPCSNGRGHSYYANIYVLDGEGNKIDGSYIVLGRY